MEINSFGKSTLTQKRRSLKFNFEVPLWSETSSLLPARSNNFKIDIPSLSKTGPVNFTNWWHEKSHDWNDRSRREELLHSDRSMEVAGRGE